MKISISTYPFSTKTDVYSFNPIRLSSSSTVVGHTFLELRSSFLIDLPSWSGITSTFENLKNPTFPFTLPFHMPETFIESTSIISPVCKEIKAEINESRGLITFVTCFLLKQPNRARRYFATNHFTLNFSVSFSNGKFVLSWSALARHIGTIVALSSADSELLGLPDLTSACVPAKFQDYFN